MDSKPIISLANKDELGHYLDTHCDSWNVKRYNCEMLTDLKEVEIPSELKDYQVLEQIVLGFWFDECTAKREWSATTDTGEEVGSPLPSQLQPASFDYFVQRFDQTTNPFLKARYGLVLWNAPKPYKHIRYLKEALNNLLIAIDQSDCRGKDNHRKCTELLKQACAIAAVAKCRQEEIVSAVLDRLTNAIPFQREGRNHLIDIVTKYSKLFRHQTSDILTAVRKLFEENYSIEDYSACKHIAHIIAPFAQGGNLEVNEWHHRKGQAFEGLAKQRLTDDSSFVSIQFYTDAAQAYQLAGDEAAEQKALKNAQDLKENIRLGSVMHEIPVDDAHRLNAEIKSQIEHTLSFDSDTIFSYLAASDEVLPDYAEICQRVADSDFSIMDIIAVTGIDINKNFQQAEPTIDGVPSEKLRMFYQIAVTFRLSMIMQLFIEGCRKEKITFAALRNYLNKNSWIAQPLSETNFDGRIDEYTWQPILYPALEEFFKQLQITIQEDSQEQPSFVLCMDSLTLKIEGLLREVLQRIGATTLATNKKSDLREVFFDDLLKIAHENQIINESELFYFRFVFTPFSQNIRNNITHSYYHSSHYYSLENMIMVICALLRLVKGRFTDKPVSE